MVGAVSASAVQRRAKSAAGPLGHRLWRPPRRVRRAAPGGSRRTGLDHRTRPVARCAGLYQDQPQPAAHPGDHHGGAPPRALRVVGRALSGPGWRLAVCSHPGPGDLHDRRCARPQVPPPGSCLRECPIRRCTGVEIPALAVQRLRPSSSALTCSWMRSKPRLPALLDCQGEAGGNAPTAVRRTHHDVLQLWWIREGQVGEAHPVILVPCNQVVAVPLVKPRQTQHGGDPFNFESG